MYNLAVCSGGMIEKKPRLFRQSRPASEYIIWHNAHFPANKCSGCLHTCTWKRKKMSFDNYNTALRGQVQVLVTLTSKHDWAGSDPPFSTYNSVINIRDFPARNAYRASVALRRSAKAVPACRRWSPPASCTCTCSAAVDAILHSFKNAQVVIPHNDRSLSQITTCMCALWPLHGQGTSLSLIWSSKLSHCAQAQTQSKFELSRDLE